MRLREIFAPRDHYRVAVLGSRFSGKTTLINSWCGLPHPDLHTGRTLALERPMDWVDLSVKVDGRRVTFEQVADITGSESALDLWADHIRDRHIVYLLDARALCGCLTWTDWYKDPSGLIDPRGPKRISHDVGQLRMQERHRVATLSRALVVTHTDQDCRRNGLGHDISHEEYAARVEREVRAFQSELSTDAHVPVIVTPGNLEDEVVAHGVTTQLVRHFEST